MLVFWDIHFFDLSPATPPLSSFGDGELFRGSSFGDTHFLEIGSEDACSGSFVWGHPLFLFRDISAGHFGTPNILEFEFGNSNSANSGGEFGDTHFFDLPPAATPHRR